jgi:hypothetical protein
MANNYALLDLLNGLGQVFRPARPMPAFQPVSNPLPPQTLEKIHNDNEPPMTAEHAIAFHDDLHPRLDPEPEPLIMTPQEKQDWANRWLLTIPRGMDQMPDYPPHKPIYF